MKTKYIIFFVTLAAVVLLDQFLKAYIGATMNLHESIPVIEGYFNITYVKNPGAAFGFLANSAPEYRSLFLISVTVIAIVLILYFISKNTAKEVFLTFSLSLILGGAAGNLIDRIRFGEVTDYLDFYISSYHWPAFNVADSAISLGAIVLVIEIFKRRA
ncbi:MAG: signal peptidase II [Deltaproteobacteria bacterium]|nr:signal peptidase II [Deltaproteobacteria bacterium]